VLVQVQEQRPPARARCAEDGADQVQLGTTGGSLQAVPVVADRCSPCDVMPVDWRRLVLPQKRWHARRQAVQPGPEQREGGAWQIPRHHLDRGHAHQAGLVAGVGHQVVVLGHLVAVAAEPTSLV